jgi:cell division protein FtsX
MAFLLKYTGLSQFRNGLRTFKITMRPRAASMNDSLRDTLMVEMKYFLAQDKIFQQSRATRPKSQGVLIVRYGRAMVGRQASMAKLMQLPALTHGILIGPGCGFFRHHMSSSRVI